jgi:hypothetical protein
MKATDGRHERLSLRSTLNYVSRCHALGDVAQVARQDAPADVAQQPDLPMRAAAA